MGVGRPARVYFNSSIFKAESLLTVTFGYSARRVCKINLRAVQRLKLLLEQVRRQLRSSKACVNMVLNFKLLEGLKPGKRTFSKNTKSFLLLVFSMKMPVCACLVAPSPLFSRDENWLRCLPLDALSRVCLLCVRYQGFSFPFAPFQLSQR